MELAVAFVGGASAKLYDDIVDDGIPVSDIVKESLKGVQWMSLAALSLNDFNFAAIIYLIVIVNYITTPSAYTFSYEKSLLIIYPLIFLLNYSTIKSLNSADIFLPVVFLFLIGVDTLIVPENISYKKLIIRCIVSLALFILLLLCNYLNISSSIKKFLMYSFAYLLTSSLYHLYVLYYPKTQKQPIKEENPIKEEQKTVKAGEA